MKSWLSHSEQSLSACFCWEITFSSCTCESAATVSLPVRIDSNMIHIWWITFRTVQNIPGYCWDLRTQVPSERKIVPYNSLAVSLIMADFGLSGINPSKGHRILFWATIKLSTAFLWVDLIPTSFHFLLKIQKPAVLHKNESRILPGNEMGLEFQFY